MGTKQEYEKYFFFMIMMGALIMMANLYYYCPSIANQLGMTHAAVDELFLKLRGGGLFSSDVKT